MEEDIRQWYIQWEANVEIYKELTWHQKKKEVQLENGQRTRTDISPKRTRRRPTDIKNEKMLNITNPQENAN